MSAWTYYRMAWAAIGLVVALGVSASTAKGEEASQAAPADEVSTPDLTAAGHHLRAAAQYFRQSGRVELAEQLEAEVDRLARQQSLTEKQEQLRLLQQQIDRLKEQLGQNHQVLLQLKLVECQLTDQTPTMEQLLDKVESAPEEANDIDRHNTNCVLSDLQTVNKIITELCARKQARVLAEPKLATVSGRAASLRVGGEVPLHANHTADRPPKSVQIGTSVDVYPRVRADGVVQLELKFQHSELDQSLSEEADGSDSPQVKTRAINTLLEIENGQTFVMGGLVQSAGHSQESSSRSVGLLLVVTAELVEPLAQVPQPRMLR